MVVYTNKLFGTAYRGFGHLEVLWGIERNMDLVARALGIDPLEFRLKNLLRAGETTITGELFTDGHGRPDECLRLVAEAIGWDGEGARRSRRPRPARARCAARAWPCCTRRRPCRPSRRARPSIMFNDDGSVNVLVSGVDYGQGTYTALAQIAADELKLPLEKVRVPWDSDTDFTPYDWQTVASRFTVMGGNAVIEAARDCLDQIRSVAGAGAARAARADRVRATARSGCEGQPDEKLDYSQLVLGYTYPERQQHRRAGDRPRPLHRAGADQPRPGDGPGPAGARLDLRRARRRGRGGHRHRRRSRCCSIASAFDAGKVINLQQCRTQVDRRRGAGPGLGGHARSSSSTNGRLLNNSFTDYKIPTAKDMPLEMKQFFVETPHPRGRTARAAWPSTR